MNGWQTVRLKEVSRVFNGKTPSKAEQRHVGHPVLKIKDVDGLGIFRGNFESYIDYELAGKHSARWIERGDTLILNAAHNADYVASKMFLAAGTVHGALPTGEWLLVRPDENRVLSSYLNYWLRSESSKKAIKFLVKGIHLYPKDVETLELPLPPLNDQRLIVDLLSRAEGIVRLRREAQKKADAIIPALFIEMFGDPATNPKGLVMRRVADFVSRFEGGKNLQAGSEGNTAFRILKVSAVTSGKYIEGESKPTPDSYTPPFNHIVRAGDMLFSRANTEELVGATAIVETTNGHTLLPDKLWRFVWSESVEPRYMHALFQDKSIRKALGKLSSGTSASMRNISQAKLFELNIPVADFNKQRDFAETAEGILSVLNQQKNAMFKAEATFNSILARAFDNKADLLHDTLSERVAVA